MRQNKQKNSKYVKKKFWLRKTVFFLFLKIFKYYFQKQKKTKNCELVKKFFETFIVISFQFFPVILVPFNRSHELLTGSVSHEPIVEQRKVLVVPNDTPSEMTVFQFDGVPGKFEICEKIENFYFNFISLFCENWAEFSINFWFFFNFRIFSFFFLFSEFWNMFRFFCEI